MALIPASQHLHIGAILFSGMDQIDFTGPFEVFSRLPNSTFYTLAKDRSPIRDARGLILTPEMEFADAPRLDLLTVPGGFGQEELMEDEQTLAFIRSQFAGGAMLFAVCTGALICGAAGLLRGVRATTHWRSFDLLPYFGAIPVDERVVEDGRIVSAAGVTAGIDGALRVAALLRGEHTAQEIQLYMQYAPEPPFRSGTPKTAPPTVVEAATRATAGISEKRKATAERFAQQLGVTRVFV